ncbi:FAD synthase-like isoform X2 [Phymastichus coffea]|uniref:FAD synthase-like isoform X2 n=1 Tax=Phymastichus coffea TaxID=108790 RepID=UPI00273CA6E9|nr:FAD synthase-like isoform X2 [Phymastichus coffea]
MADEHVAAVVIIGDEILKGQVQDANTAYLAKNLLEIGIKIRRVVIVPDEVELIAKEVSELSKAYPLVFTSGGVGPTHDDVTYEAVAKGLGLGLMKQNKSLLESLSQLFPDRPESRRLALVPCPCELVGVVTPGSNMQNVYVLPGSPCYFRPAVDQIIPSLERGQPLHTDHADVEADELSIVPVLDEEAKRWTGVVSIGSYPQPGKRTRTRITFESRDKEALDRAKKDMEDKLADSVGERQERAAFNVDDAKKVYESRGECPHVRRAFEALEECYERYQPSEVFLSFNGGKDCTVVLHLAATLAKLRKFEPPLSLYVTHDAFPEVDAFVGEAASYYGFELISMDGLIREALSKLLERERPGLKAVLMGTRKNDPGAHSLDTFAPTDPSWPSIMRVFPIISWSYSQVWDFLINHKVPYCSLYDEGYSSLGARDSTTKNPLLRNPDNPSLYLAAHTLADDSSERHGRS